MRRFSFFVLEAVLDNENLPEDVGYGWRWQLTTGGRPANRRSLARGETAGSLNRAH
jgi:hypothetical protein